MTALPAAALARTLADRDEQHAIDLLRDDVAMWRAIAERWIGASVELELRLLAAERAVREKLDALTEAHRREQRLREQLQEQRELWARCAERMMRDDA